MKTFVLSLFFLLTVSAWCGESSYRLRLPWLPRAEFAGIYMAAEAGLFRNAGVTVELEHGNLNEAIFDFLKPGENNLVIGWPLAALECAGRGMPVVNAGQFARSSALMLIARKSAGIHRISDVSGHRIGLWPSGSLRAPLEKYLRYCGVKNCRILPVYSSADLFLYGGVDVTSGLYYDEYYRIYAAGVEHSELKLFPLNEVFPALVDDGLYCLRETYDRASGSLRKIRDAVLSGWELAFQNPENTLRIVKKYCREARIPFNPGHQRWMLNVMKKMIQPTGKRHNGVFSRTEFEQLNQILSGKARKISYEQFVPEAKK